MLFQNNALFDFMTVGDNVAFPLVRQGELGGDEIRARVAERLRAVGLAGSEDKYPDELSGGMKKRAALARAVIARPPVVHLRRADRRARSGDHVEDLRSPARRARREAEPGSRARGRCAIRCRHLRTSTRCAPSRRASACSTAAACATTATRAAIADSDDPVVRQFVRGELEGPL